MNILKNKKILLIITGSIAAYKSLDLIRILRKKEVELKTILTESATKFITPLSVASLSKGKVYTKMFNHDNEAEMDHIALSRWADLILLAPATANIISKLSAGISDDLASTLILASNKQVLIAPAMNVRMWEHSSNKESLKKLLEYGYKFIGPEIGDMACGEFGEGKMTEPKNIENFLISFFGKIHNNKQLKALVTAGPTQELIDPVRFLSNKSSGKQGYEIAKSLRDNGFNTTLIAGPTKLKDLENINLIKVNSGFEMMEQVKKNLPSDVAILSAAVSDFIPDIKSDQKIKKNEKEINLKLKRNIDILDYISKHNSLRPKLVIGFAAETQSLEENSKKKLLNKNCDWIIGNDVSNSNIGFDSDYNEVSIYYRNEKSEKIPFMKKSLIADEIVKRVMNEING